MYVCKIRPLARGQTRLGLVSLSWCWPLPGSLHARELLPRPHPCSVGPILLPGRELSAL